MFFKKKELTAEEKKRKNRNNNILLGLLILIRIFFFEHFFVPSSSMTPTLITGDIVFAKKYAFSWNRMSIPFGMYLPFLKKGIKLNDYKRGDVGVFVLKKDPKIYYVKRIVGLEGDLVQMINGVLHINGKASKMTYIDEFTFKNDQGNMETGQKWEVALPDSDVKYFVYRNQPFGQGHIDNTLEYEVPKGHLWVQGDFHTGSADSFCPHIIGPVEDNAFVGKPCYVLIGTNSRLQNEPSWIKWIAQLPYRLLIAFKEINFERFSRFVK